MIEDYLPFLLVGLKALLMVLSVVFLISGLDELLFDIVYVARRLYYKLYISRRYPPLTEDKLLAVPEQLVAIMVPCWDESAVIRQMLQNTIQTINYTNYHIFVGVYPNDPATHREVELVRETYANVHRVVCPKDGPTNKADCLNWVYEGIQVFEKDNGLRFDIYVMNDSEDLVHPLYLKLFNYLIPRKDMVQLPVFPLPGRWWQLTRCHYMDEFAENHSKDLAVREILSKSVPSAGVGSAYSRRAMEALAADSNNQLFNINSLTEDYDFGLRLSKFGYPQIFVRHALRRMTTKKTLFGGTRKVERKEYVVIRELFPLTFSQAVRQKGRWVVGIALQGWALLGWQGSFWHRYLLARDRKSLLTNQVNMLGNFVVPLVAGISLWQYLDPEAYRYPPLVDPDSFLWYLTFVNLFFLLWRMAWRAVYVHSIYGGFQAALSVPRLFWGNLINFCATWRAIRIYTKYLFTGKIIAWDKTAHVYPTEAELRSYRRKLGDLLLDRRFVSVAHLEEALEIQKTTGQPLGDVLVSKGYIKEDDLVQTLGMQFRLTHAAIDPYRIPLEVLALLPRETALARDMMPLRITERGALAVAVLAPPSPEGLRRLEQIVGMPVELYITSKSNLAFALRRGYERLNGSGDGHDDMLGAALVDAGACTREQLEEALRVQRSRYARLGDILVQQGVVPHARMGQLVDQYLGNGSSKRLGDFLVESGAITTAQLEDALAVQAGKVPFLGEVLSGMGVDKAAIDKVLQARQVNNARS